MGRAGLVLATLAAIVTGCSQVAGTPTAPPQARTTTSPAEAAATLVKSSIQNKLDTDADLSSYHLKVDHVVLVNKAGNEFKGIATIKTARGTTHDVSIDVTADGDNVIWEAAPGAFAFVLQEPQPSRPPAAAPPAAPPPPVGAQALRPAETGRVYVATKSGKTRCQVSAAQVDCQSQFTFATPMVNGCPANGLSFYTNGRLQWICGDLGNIPTVTLDYGTYHAISWTIDASHDGTRFTHDGTGRSVSVSLDSVTVN